MPFKSEKQRRYLWLKHPRIAKRWAHLYPESNKDLPMTADSKTANVLGSAGVGAGIGGLAGLGAGGLVGLLAPKGKRLRAALMGAGTLGPLGALSGGVMGASYAHDPRAFAQGIVPAVTAGAIGSGIGTYLASKKPKAKSAPADSKKKDAPGDDIKEAALSLTNLPIKQPSIDRAHSTTFRVEKAINKAKEEREKNEMSTSKSAAVEFGKKVKQGENKPKSVAPGALDFGRLVKRAAINPEVMSGGLAGAGIGALGGGLAGLIAPGEEEDEDGNVVRRGRLGGALRGALGGAGLGGLAGAGMGYLRPTETGQGVDYLKNMIGMGGAAKPSTTPAPSQNQTLDELIDAVGEEPVATIQPQPVRTYDKPVLYGSSYDNARRHTAKLDGEAAARPASILKAQP